MNVAGTASPQLPKHATQTQIAQAYMTPETADVLTPALLNSRIGRSTVAGGINDSIIFRVRDNGTDRQLVPDSKLAAELMQTPAGPKLLLQLEHAAASTDWKSGKSKLNGFVLPKNLDAVAAAQLLHNFEPGHLPTATPAEPKPRLPHTISKFNKEIYADAHQGSKSAGAWYSRGWVTMMPDTARAMLVSVGAYQPVKNVNADKRLRQGAKFADYINGTSVHEAQHSITPRKGRYENVRWLEEGIANIFSKTPTFHAETERVTGVNPHSYSGHLAHEPVIDLDWKPWTRTPLSPKEREAMDKIQKQRYADSQPILRGLLRMAGAHLNSNAGKAFARELLQGDELDRVAGKLANAIIARNGLDRDEVYEAMRSRIKVAVKDPKSLDKLADEFGIPRDKG